MKHSLKVEPAIPVGVRHKIVHLLEVEGFKLIGTGQMVDGSECDISFEKDDSQ